MIIIENAVRQVLVSDTGVKALVAARVYPNAAPENIRDAEPTKFQEYVVYERVAGGADHHIAASSGLAYARIQITTVAIDYAKAHEIAEEIRDALDGYSGVVTVGAETLTVEVIEIEETRDQYVAPSDGNDVGRHLVIQDIEAGYQESVPTFS